MVHFIEVANAPINSGKFLIFNTDRPRARVKISISIPNIQNSEREQS